MVLCHSAQENEAHANRVSLLTGRIKLQFSCKCNSVMSDPNGTEFTMECLPLRRGHISNLKKISIAIPKIRAIKLWKN